MTLTRRFFSAPSLTQALLAAARYHRVEPDDLAYEVIDKKHGFLKTPRGVVIEVDPDTPTRPRSEPPTPEPPTPEPPPLPPTLPPAEPEGREHPGLEPVSVETAAMEVDLAAGEPEPSPEPLSHPALTPVLPVADPAEGSVRVDARETERLVEAPPPEAGTVESPVAEDGAAQGSEPRPTTPSAEDDDEGESGVPEPNAVAAGSGAPDEAIALDDDLREAVAQAVDELAHLAGLRVQAATIEIAGAGLEVDLEGPDGSRMTARGGRALLAMQHLLPRLLFRTLGRTLHCRLDCEGFHAARNERLERLAQRAADRVRTGGRAWLLEPMPPDERRLVHMALADVPDIETESVGEGFLKRVRVAQV